MPDILGNPAVTEIAKNHEKTPAQILLRHIIQKGIAAIPKSTNPERLRLNLDVFSFKLNDVEMQKMDNLNADIRILDFGAFNGYSFDFFF